MKKIAGDLAIALGFVVLVWFIYATGNLFGELASCGVVPRGAIEVGRILCAPLVHVDLGHIIANSIPLGVLAFFVIQHGRSQFLLVTLLGAVLGGLGVWLFGHSGNHIGASGLIFAYFGYLLASAFFTRTLKTILVAALTFFLYGYILMGVFPSGPSVSWEGHLFGLVGGVVVAALMSKTFRA